MSSFAKSLRQAQILTRLRRVNPRNTSMYSCLPCEMFNPWNAKPIFLGWLKFSPSLTFNKIERFETASYVSNFFKDAVK